MHLNQLADSIKVKLADGNDYELVPAGLGDAKALCAHIQSENAKRFFEATRGVPMPDDVRAKSLAELIARPVDFFDALSTLSGKVFLLYRCISKKHPTVTLDGLPDLLGSNLGEIFDLVLQVSGLKADEKKADGVQPSSP